MTRWSWPEKLTLRLNKSEALNASLCFCLLPAPSTDALMCVLMRSIPPLFFCSCAARGDTLGYSMRISATPACAPVQDESSEHELAFTDMMAAVANAFICIYML